MNKIPPGSNMRWEASRIMLPEHINALRKRKIEQKKVEKPILDEQEWEIIEQNIAYAMGETLPLEIRYFRDGFIITLVGFALYFDTPNKILRFEDKNGDRRNLFFGNILGAEISDEKIRPYVDSLDC